MCFSAKVKQDVHKLAREFHAKVGDEAFLDLFERRSAGEAIKVSRSLEMAFRDPANATERQIKEVNDAFSANQARNWETEIFKQRQRLTAAEESLKIGRQKQLGKQFVLPQRRSIPFLRAYQI